jgi:hypothetical protein
VSIVFMPLERRHSGVEQRVHAIARQELAAGDLGHLLPQVVDKRADRGGAEVVTADIQGRFDHGHFSRLYVPLAVIKDAPNPTRSGDKVGLLGLPR